MRWRASYVPDVIDAAASPGMDSSPSKYNWVVKVGYPGGVILKWI